MGEWLTVVTISFITSTINIIHIIIGLAKTPSYAVYLATGHYYLDYFLYLQYISRGFFGSLLPLNYYATDDPGLDWRFFPYLLIGKLCRFLNLSPMAGYWLAVFLLTFFLLIGFYWLINLILKKETFYLKIIAFIITIISGPVYKINLANHQLILIPFDFWYGPSNFTRRFGPVPYHLLGNLFIVLILILFDRFWQRLQQKNLRSFIFSSGFIILLITFLMIFSPFPLFSLLPAIYFFSLLSFIKKKQDRKKIFLFNFFLTGIIIPLAFLLRKQTGYQGFSFEIAWIERVPWWFLLLNLGPMVIFFPFGLIRYLKSTSPAGQILFLFSLTGFLLFFSPLAAYLGTHNLRFFSSVSYVFYGGLAALGIKTLTSYFKGLQKTLTVILSLFFIIYSSIFIYDQLKIKINGFDSRTPVVDITYVPKELLINLQRLNDFSDNKNVLSGPFSNVGMLVPVLTNRKVYIGHLNATFQLNKKQAIAYRFFTKEMKKNEAKEFLRQNNIGYIILTPLDYFNSQPIESYGFLKPIVTTKTIKIWRVKE